MEALQNIFDIVGNFHPVLLHLPIGILIYVYLHLGYEDFISRKRKKTNFRFALGLGAFTSVLTVITGLLLAQHGGYDDESLKWHKWLGLLVAVAAVVLYLGYHVNSSGKGYFALFSLTIIALMVTGHLGGTITHGEGFLLSTNNEAVFQPFVTNVEEAKVFQDLVQPIVKKKCQNCHNARKSKGDLVLTSPENWEKGGKSGKLFIPGEPGKSLLFERIHLPKEEEKHMPPSGKPQLTLEEISFLEWWVGAMNSFEDSVSELSPPESVLNYIKRTLNPITANLPSASDEDINELRGLGIAIQRISENMPWLEVIYQRGEKVNASDLRKLGKFKENIRVLKLSNVGVQDGWINRINKFVNLRSLDLSLNKLTTDGVKRLEVLNDLEYFNLYGTEVDVEVLNHLKLFPNLKEVYLWQTNVKEEDLKTVQLPEKLMVNLGADMEIFSSIKLLPPTFESEKVIFPDSIKLILSHLGNNSKIFYTMDGSPPNENALEYKEPIFISSTTEIKAIARMQGWEDSEITSKSFLKSGAIPIACTIVPPPNEKYEADGNTTLIDAVKASEVFSDGKWLGFQGKDVSITLDLGEAKNVKSVSFGALRDIRSYIFHPVGASVSASVDGFSFKELGKKSLEQVTKIEENQIRDIIIDIHDTTVQYIRLDIEAQKTNPAWHIDPGAMSWLFLDEIVIE